MPIQKDLKKLVRARLQKSREAYTAARLQLLNKQQASPTRNALQRNAHARIRKRWLPVRVKSDLRRRETATRRRREELDGDTAREAAGSPAST